MYTRIARTFLHFLFLLLVSGNISADTVRFPDGNQGTGALGRIEPRSRVIKVSHNAGPEGARVEQLFFAEGDQVKSGDTLAVLSDHDRKTAEVEAAGTRIKVLKAQREIERIAFNFNQKEHLRYQSLRQDSMASISLADAKYLAFAQSEANLKQLSAEIAHAEAEQRIAVEALKNTRIHAPISGTILKILTWPGERIKDGGLLEMADLTQLDIVAEIYESDLNQVKAGQKASISAKGFAQAYTAEVRELGYLVRKNDLNDTDPLADRDNRIIEVRLTLDPSAVADLQHQIFRQVHVRIVP
jgi:HlyD family secretion protein